MIFGANTIRTATLGSLAAALLLPPISAHAQNRNKSAIVVEDTRSTSTADRSSNRQRRSNSRNNPAASPTPSGSNEFVLGGRTSRISATLADSKGTTSVVAAVKTETTGTPSLVDRLLAVGDESLSTTATASGRKNAVVFTLRGQLPEREQVQLFGAPTRSLASVLTLLRKAREDKDLSHVVLRFSGLGVGLADAQEIRSLVTDIRSRKKKVIALLEDESQVSYLIATAADEIIIPPSGGIGLTGLRADSYFLRGLLEKVGMQAEFIHQGEYKSMGEVFERDSFSPAARRNMEEMVDSLYSEMKTLIASGRGMTPEEAGTIIDKGPATTSQALERRLVDRAEYSDVVLETLKKDVGKVITGEEYARQGRTSAADEMGNPFALLMGMGRGGAQSRQDPALARLPQVAVVYANGSISQGGSEEGFEDTDSILSDDLIRTLEEVRKDRKVKAVLLRVNSPGGSAFASDLIWRKIRELDNEKPVIASMGSVAASGGYYIAMGARKVYATSGTVTGSIGVVGGKFSLAGTYKFLGITKESIGRGQFSDLFSDTRLFTPTERTLIDNQMREVYEDFLSKAARSRSMTRDQVHELAQGRVWTGAEAVERRLVDSTEGLAGAILEIKRQIGVKESDQVALVPYPKEKTLFDLLSRVFSSSGGSGARLRLGTGTSIPKMPELLALMEQAPPGLRQAMITALRLPELLRREKVLLLAPVALDIQ